MGLVKWCVGLCDGLIAGYPEVKSEVATAHALELVAKAKRLALAYNIYRELPLILTEEAPDVSPDIARQGWFVIPTVHHAWALSHIGCGFDLVSTVISDPSRENKLVYDYFKVINKIGELKE